ncbi:MAG TPA: sulfur carrier protein ThiS [Acidimicrobiales bacterium]
MIDLILNGEPCQLADGVTVGAVVDELGLGRRGVAVAVNEEVVPRSSWDGTSLADEDRVEILSAVQGGC